MAIRRQNRTLLFVFIFVVIALALVLRREKKVREYFEFENVQDEAGISEVVTTTVPSADSTAPPQEVASTKAETIASDHEAIEKQKAFVQIFDAMADCLALRSASYSEKDPIQMDTIISQLQTDIGAPRFNSDLWMNWHLRTREGKEKRIRLEISSASDEPTYRELRYFNVDREGIPQPVELGEEKSLNPSDEMLNQMLREGEVFYKERAGFYAFPNGERLEFLEKNGELSEIEMVRGEGIFKCSDIRARENCRCLK